MATLIPPPPPTVPIAWTKGVPSFVDNAWARYLTDELWRRVGGFQGSSNTDLEARVEALETEVAALGDGSHRVAATVDFGASFTDKAQLVVTGQTWVTASSVITPTVMCPIGVDTDEIRLLDMRPVISDLVAGVGFTVTLYSEPEARGTYTVSCVGV